MQITEGAVFQDNIYFLIVNEGIEVANNVRRVEALHGLYLFKCLKANFLRYLCHVYNLDDIIRVVQQRSGLALTRHTSSRRRKLILDLEGLPLIEQYPFRAGVADGGRLQAFDLVDITKGPSAEGTDHIKHFPANFYYFLFGVRVGCLLLHFILI